MRYILIPLAVVTLAAGMAFFVTKFIEAAIKRWYE